MPVLCSLAVLFFCQILTTTAMAQERVALELVLAIDTSTSVDASEFELQRTGIAQALRHPKVLTAIEGLGAEGLVLSVVQWSGAGQQRFGVDWQRINGKNAAFKAASNIERMPRLLSGFTDIAGAIEYSTNVLLNNQFNGERLAIDVSGDGTSDRNDPSLARDRAISNGVTINGLIIHSVEYDLGDLAGFALEEHYRTRVIGGAGAFLLEAKSFESFAVAMREKLYREISGPLFAQTSNN